FLALALMQVALMQLLSYCDPHQDGAVNDSHQGVR
ncbi:MAG: hypothetical protein AVDCRST_MAG56-8070, partial [uncultured Cytophagales bacterium]